MTISDRNCGAVSRYAMETARALQGAIAFAMHADDELAKTLEALQAGGLTIDAIAESTRLDRQFVTDILAGRRLSDRFL